MGDDANGNGKSKRRLNDYAGLAALVAAIGAIGFGVMDRMNTQAEAERMNRSLFEHAKAQGDGQVAVLEWRVEQLERLLSHDHHIEVAPQPAPRPRRPARAPASFPDEHGDEAAGDEPELDAPVAADIGAPPPMNISGDVSFDQMQQAVRGGGVYEAKK